MSETRYFLKNGDPTSTGGQLIAIRPKFIHHGVAMGIEGDIATCPACKSSGPCFNDCTPNCHYHGTRVLVSGARVYCKCSEHPIVFSTQTDSTVVVDRKKSAGRGFMASPLTGGGTHTPKYAMEKRTDEKLASESATNTEQICPNMSNAEFRSHIMDLRDEALTLVASRLSELKRWSAADARWFLLWFGTTDDAARVEIARGLARMRTVLSTLSPANFIRHSADAMRVVGCVSRENSPGAVAEVCAPDTATHTIAIRLDFCTLRPRHPRFDSQLLTLVHEVSHFTDVMNSQDYWYSTHSAKDHAGARDARNIENADNIAGYVVCSE